MLKIEFTKIPKNGKNIFPVKHFLRKPKEVDITTADKLVRKYAKTLSENQREQIAFTIFDDGEEEITETDFETEILSEDQDSGLIALIDRDTEDAELSAEEVDLLDEIRNEVIEETDSTEDDKFSDSSVKKYANTTVNEDTTVNDEDVFGSEVEPARADSTLQMTSSYEDNDKSQQVDDEELENSFPSLNQAEEMVATAEQDLNKDISKDDEVITQGKYIDTTDIIERLPKGYDKNQFALDNLKHDLGFVDNPQDKYQKKLNEQITNLFRTSDMTSIQRKYDENLAKIKASVADDLTNAYHRINKAELDNTVELKVHKTLLELTHEAEAKKKFNITQFEKDKKNYAEKLEEEDQNELIEYKKALLAKRKIAIRDYNVQKEVDTNKANREIDDQLRHDKDLQTNLARNKEVNYRNKQLADERTSIANAFDLKVRDNYDANNNLFEAKLGQVIEGVNREKEVINKERLADKKREEAKAEKAAEIARKEKELALKERELKQNAKFAEQQKLNFEKLPKEFATAIASAIADESKIKPNIEVTVNGDLKNKAPEETKKNIEAVSQSDSASNSTVSLPKKVKFNESDNNDAKDKIVALILLVIFISGLVSLVYLPSRYSSPNQDQVQPRTSVQRKKVSSEESVKQKLVKEKKVNKHKVTQKKVVEQYGNLKYWSEKRDFLAGLLGQNDARNLQKIASRYPSKMAKLYSSLVREDKAQTRKIWLQMSDMQRSEISNVAKKATAAAFYDISDWHNGWLARYAY
ncbi:hypothetical protein SAMN04487792_1623 [Lactobacillus bombicola]|uniref:Uncharacterized protein n=1 Tax=Lactobacillus bombicola TaxID=1505723 RepID=A0A1I1U0G4_9LACO|nr:hypothetical protein [Lactobacillus bombicola]SFD62183.1 hypothetical protein SAMN04487792_1623 [Lactobacillus bombicola]